MEGGYEGVPFNALDVNADVPYERMELVGAFVVHDTIEGRLKWNLELLTVIYSVLPTYNVCRNHLLGASLPHRIITIFHHKKSSN